MHSTSVWFAVLTCNIRLTDHYSHLHAVPWRSCTDQRAALGHWVFKSKSSQNSTSPRGACKGYIFAMEVTEELETWPEQDTHNRRWVSCPAPLSACAFPGYSSENSPDSDSAMDHWSRSLPPKPTSSAGTTGCGRRSPRCWRGCRCSSRWPRRRRRRPHRSSPTKLACT